jgi:hypothetical protein
MWSGTNKKILGIGLGKMDCILYEHILRWIVGKNSFAVGKQKNVSWEPRLEGTARQNFVGRVFVEQAEMGIEIYWYFQVRDSLRLGN